MNVDPNAVISKLAARVSQLEVEKAALEAAVDQLLAHECPGCAKDCCAHTEGTAEASK